MSTEPAVLPWYRDARAVTGVLAAVALYLAFVSVVHYHADDGYIALRYVQNLLAGHGLVYNPGERVEGYNCFLWLIMLGAAGKVLPIVPLHVVAEGLGIVFGIATIVLTGHVGATRLGFKGWWVAAPATLMATHSGFVAWSTGGLETTLFAGLLLLAASAHLRWLETGQGALHAPLVLGIGSLTRPDAVPVFVAALAHAAFVVLRRDGLRPALLLSMKWSATWAVIVLPWFAWRLNYYGWLLPNTAYAKVGSGLAQYRRGLEYILEYALEYGLYLVLLPAAVALLVRRERRAAVLAWLLAAHLGFVVLVGGDGLAFHRFLVYTAPLVVLLAVVGFRALHDVLSVRWRLVAAPAALAMIGLTSLSVANRALVPLVAPERRAWMEPHAGLRFPLRDGPWQYTWFDNYFIDRQAIAIRHLASVNPNGLIATTPAGAVAYFGNFAVIDMLGLNDEHIAHVDIESMGRGRAGHEKGDGAYVLSRRPDAILLGNVAVLNRQLDSATMSRKLVLLSERQIWAAPSFHTDYELVSVPVDSAGPFQWFTYARRRDGAFAPVPSTADRNQETRR